LKDIYGIDLIFKERTEEINLLEIIRPSFNNNIMGIIIDPYHCFWSPFYQKSHYSHMMLIVDIDVIAKKYVCFDVHFNSIGYIKVDFDVVNQNFERYFVFNCEKASETKLNLVIEKIKGSIDDFDDGLYAKKTNMFDYFTKNDRKTLFPINIETSIPLINLMWIAEDKKNSSIIFRYVANKMKKYIFHPVYDLLEISEQNFLLLKSALIRYALTGILNEDKFKNIIDRIFENDALMIKTTKSILEEIISDDAHGKKQYFSRISPRKNNSQLL
jgi:hypothetical protein